MKTLKTALLSGALCALSLSALASVQPFQVNGTTVTKAAQDELIAAFVKRGVSYDEQLEKRVRYMLVRDTALVQQAKKARLEKRKDVQQEIRKARDAVLVRALIADWIEKNPVSEQDIHALYEKEKAAWGPEEVLVRHILVRDEEQAQGLLKRIHSGEKFDALAREYSIDTAQNKNAGGLIEWTSPAVFDTDFAQSFKTLKPGKITSNPVKSRLGWHIIKLEGRREAQRWANFEAVRPQLKQLLQQQKIQTFIDSVVNKARVTDVQPAKAQQTK